MCAGIACPISVNSRTLRVPGHGLDVDRVAALEHDEVRRLAGLVLDRLQVRAGGGAQPLEPVLQPARELEQLVAEQVAAARRALRRVAARRRACRAGGARCWARGPVRAARSETPSSSALASASSRSSARSSDWTRGCGTSRSLEQSVPLCGRSNTMSSAPFHSTCSPSGRNWSLPSTIVRKWLPASWPTMLANMRAAVGEEDLGLAQAAGVPEDLARGRVAGGVLGLAVEADVEVAERDPGRFAAPADVDDLRVKRQQALEGRDGLGRLLGLQRALEGEGAGGDGQHGAASLRATGSAAAAAARLRQASAPRSSVRTTRARSRRPIQGESGWR